MQLREGAPAASSPLQLVLCDVVALQRQVLAAQDLQEAQLVMQQVPRLVHLQLKGS
jgi:hypothetical protein